MLSQAARGLLSSSSLFGSRGADKENNKKGSLSKLKSKTKALRLKGANKRTALTDEQPEPTSGRRPGDPPAAAAKATRSETPRQAAPQSTSSSASERQSSRHQPRQQQSSPSADLSSGYLSQTNGFAASLRRPAQPADDEPDANNNGHLLYIMKAARGARRGDTGHYQHNGADESRRPAQATLTRLPMVPMMIDDEEGDDDDADADDETQELKLEAVSDDDTALDLERHHQSYQLMIDGLKLRQQHHQQWRRQQQQQRLDHQARFLQHGRCQQGDKSATLRHQGDANQRHLGLTDECADSDASMSSRERPHHLYPPGDHQLANLAYALMPHQSPAGLVDYCSLLAGQHSEDELTVQRRMLAPPSATYSRGKSNDGLAADQPTDPDQRRPAIIYFQPDVANSSEYYARLNSNHHQLRHRHTSFIHDQLLQHQRQISRGSSTATTRTQGRHPQPPPKLPAKPPPPPRDQHIRGQVHQGGPAKPNLASPLANKYRLQGDALPVSQLDLLRRQARNAMIDGSRAPNTRQHHANPTEFTHSHQQHIKRAKSSSQMHQISAQADKYQQHSNSQHQFAGARPVPKSTSSGRLDFDEPPPSKMSANLQAISQSRELDPEMGCCGKLAKFLLFIANVLFWCAGIALGAWGILALVEDHKYNLSQLLVFEPSSRLSLFQLLAWSFITLGGATILIGICGCSAMFKNSRWILGLYIFLILAIFALDLATGLLAIIFQERLVANVRLRLVSKLRNEYGIQASFTAAIDYIQTRYECCGLDGHFDYEQSLWRLQRLGGFEATVARTCCHLRNTLDDQAHVNPRPVNESMCQSTDVRFHQSYRFRRGCLDDLERLIRHKIWTFTIGCGIVGAIILIVLALATCFCRSIPDDGQDEANNSSSAANNSSSRKNVSNRVHQQALMYAETVAKKQQSGNHHQHYQHGHHSISRHK